MFKHLAISAIMNRNAGVISVTCILLCLTFNYTFPLHRESSNSDGHLYNNLSRMCVETGRQHKKIPQRPIKRGNNLELGLQRLRGSAQDFSKNFQSRLNLFKTAFTEDDLRKYEQLVIMKKNPFLDLKDIEFKFSPHDKHVRQSVNYDTGFLTQHEGDPGIWESMEDVLPNVEVINRGLTGFGIPAKIVQSNQHQPKGKLSEIPDTDEIKDVTFDKNLNVLPTLRNDNLL